MKPLSLNKNKKGLIDGIITFIVIAVIALIIAPILFKVVMTPVKKFGEAVRPISNESADAVEFGYNKFVSFWDTIIVLFIFANILFLFITSFLVDIHPAFIVLYIIGAAILFMFTPNYLEALTKIYSQASLSTEVGYLPMLNWIINNFGMILLGVIVINGIIMFVKFNFFGGR